MLQIEFKFSDKSSKMDNLSSFDLGDMDLRGDLGTASSHSRVPDQSMMIVLSISPLLDGVRRFLSTPQKEYKFVGVDSSFAVVFSKKNDGKIDILVDKCLIETTNARQLKADIEASVLRFIEYLDASAVSPTTDAPLLDLHDAFQDFQHFSVE